MLIKHFNSSKVQAGIYRGRAMMFYWIYDIPSLALAVLLLLFIAAMDNPFRGSVSISPEAFQLAQKRLMAP
ncbi:MAG: hypothetical protein D4R48_03685 [Nitrosomonadales bacterium]|nr:MAG: hypothetical protein D4R48_03685 [Nitrosomonadales bacterium]